MYNVHCTGQYSVPYRYKLSTGSYLKPNEMAIAYARIMIHKTYSTGTEEHTVDFKDSRNTCRSIIENMFCLVFCIAINIKELLGAATFINLTYCGG